MPWKGLRFLTPEQAGLVAALAELIFPAEPDGFGAGEAHVVGYIDGQLAGGWGAGERMYRAAPFETPDHAGHGWQSSLTPADAWTHGLAAIERLAQTRHGAAFTALPADRRRELLAAVADGSAETFVSLEPSAFFGLLRQALIEGLFSDPVHGGNHESRGWRWLGYPGVAGDYAELIEADAPPTAGAASL